MSDKNHTKEADRLEALCRYHLLDTPVEAAFDRITSLAARFFYTPVALISLLDKDRVWLKSHHGLKLNQFPCWPGLCASSTFSDGVYVVEDAVTDPRTLANPLVKGDFGLRFYAAAPLLTHDGHRLGVLSLMDFAPRLFGAEAREVLVQLAELVMDQVELRHGNPRAAGNHYVEPQTGRARKGLSGGFPWAQHSPFMGPRVEG